MNLELKQKWLDALRSGKYKQGTQYLNSSSGYCCLGVLCEVAGIPAKPEEYWSTAMRYDGNNKLLTFALQTQFELSPLATDTLMKMNDGWMCYPSAESEGSVRKHTFAEIADYIEKEL